MSYMAGTSSSVSGTVLPSVFSETDTLCMTGTLELALVC